MTWPRTLIPPNTLGANTVKTKKKIEMTKYTLEGIHSVLYIWAIFILYIFPDRKIQTRRQKNRANISVEYTKKSCIQ